MSSNILLLLLSLGVMLYLSPLLALVSVVVAPSLLVVSYRMRWRIFPATWDGQQREGDLVQIVDEDLNGVRVVKRSVRSSARSNAWRPQPGPCTGRRCARCACNRATSRSSRRSRCSRRWRSSRSAGGLALHHQITLGTFLAFSTYLTQLMAPLGNWRESSPSASRLGQGSNASSSSSTCRPPSPTQPDAVDLPELRGDIQFSNVRFRYGDGDPVLSGVDLHIAPGERVAIVGPSGSGKSTLAMLVPRFYDQPRAPCLLMATTCAT